MTQGPSIDVAPARPEDAETIARCNEAMALETEGKRLDPATVRRGVAAVFAEPTHGFYLVARAGDEPVGCLLVTYEWSDWRNGRIWWIQSVYVAEGWRRRGVYRTMYAALKPMARAAGAIGFRLYVEQDNRVAQGTYAALGMAPCAYRLYEALDD